MPKTGLDEFRAVITDIRSLHSWAIGGSAAAPLADLVLNIGPPYPPGSWLITCLLELIIFISIFHFWFKDNARRLNRKMLAALIVLLLSFFSYMYLFASFTYILPSSGKRLAKGLEVRADIQPLIPEHFSSEDAALAGSEYKADEVWTGPSIVLVQMFLLASWMLLFSSLSAFVGTFVIAQRRRILQKPPARRREPGR